MTKLFLILSTVALLGSAAVAIANRSSFINVRKEKDDVNSQIKDFYKEYEDKYGPEFERNETGIKDTERLLEENRANIDLTQTSIISKSAEIKVLKDEESPLDARLAEMNTLIERIRIKYPGVDFDNLDQKIEELRLQEKGLNEQVQALTAEGEVIGRRLKTNTGVISRLEEKQQERNIGIARNSMEATITAVNHDWGFAVFSAGKSSGVSTESKLFVKRGPNIVGRLNIVSIEPRITVANIDQDSLANGARVLPGDRVIFGNLQE